MARDSIDNYTKRELYDLAKERGVPGRGTMDKPALFAALGLGDEKGGGRASSSSAPAKEPGVTTAPVAGPVPAPTSPSAPAAAPAGAESEPYTERGAPIPDSYGDDKLAAMIRDPRWVYCYWELDGGGCQRVIDERGQAFADAAAWVIREHNLSSGSSDDAGIDAGARSWYLQIEPGTRYRFEIGMKSPEGEFLSIAASGEVETPREGLSDQVDEQWMLIREELEQLIEAMDGVTYGVPGSALGRKFEGSIRLNLLGSSMTSPGGKH